MRQFLDAITVPSVWAICVLELLLLVFMIVRFIKTKSKLTIVIACITFGLFFDAFIIALGAFHNAGGLQGISQWRFILHGLLIPLMFVVATFALDLKKPWKYVVFAVTLALMVAGCIEGSSVQIGLTTGLVDRFKALDTNPKWISTITDILNYGTVFPLVAVGIYIWIKQKNPFLFLAGISMLGFTILGVFANIFTKVGDVKGDYMFFISMYGEILMVTFMQIYTIKKEGKCL